MKKSILISVALLVSCSEEDNTRPTPVATPLPSSTTSITASAGGTATSRDGNFSIQIGPMVLSSDASIVIVEGVRSPAPALSFGKAYDVRVNPTSAVPSGSFSAEVRVAWPSSMLGSTPAANVGLASGDTVGGPVIDFVSGSYSVGDNEFLGTTTHLSWFVLLDAVAYSSCSCNTTSSCDAGCESCDPDCVGCTCDVTGGCDPSCSCDPDCLGCTCDVTVDCDPNCTCDPDCGSGCSCDVTTGFCDSNCFCDLDCPDTGGVYPYVPCTSSCTVGVCVEGYCAGTCNQSPSSCGSGYLCDDGMCLKTCMSDAECTGGGGADCCLGDTCAPAEFCPPDVPPGWYCDEYYYGTGDGCDCGCGELDPDCSGMGCAPGSCYAEACEYCYDAEGQDITCSP